MLPINDVFTVCAASNSLIASSWGLFSCMSRGAVNEELRVGPTITATPPIQTRSDCILIQKPGKTPAGAKSFIEFSKLAFDQTHGWEIVFFS